MNVSAGHAMSFVGGRAIGISFTLLFKDFLDHSGRVPGASYPFAFRGLCTACEVYLGVRRFMSRVLHDARYIVYPSTAVIPTPTCFKRTI